MTAFQKSIEAAFKVFSRRNGLPVTTDSISEIQKLLNKVTKQELNLDPTLLENRLPCEGEAPVTYVRIVEHKIMTVAIFILREGKKLPLHDHPGMHGLIKVVHGSLNVKTYSALDQSMYQIPTSSEEDLHEKYGRKIPVVPAKLEGTWTCNESDDCMILTPQSGNLHEITAVNGTAAFLDFLSPPYCHERFSRDGYRPCNYFSESDSAQSDPDVKYIMPISAPRDYWCDEVEYTGPPVPLPPADL
ncbi:2-aminoethanethiol dioxygenase-like [Mya arenaria]|uniref:2-aminoethanethiol dioxygenase-like n=1 Tax=Mya arenaria TaxID=6604 RepID=UPI0022E349B0|nr:2-aminoethanethiol dioxygenase-like [Mya arenaria]